MSHEQSSQQDRGLFGLFGGKKDEHPQQHGTTGYNTADQGHGGHVPSGTGYGTGPVDQGAEYNVAPGQGGHTTGTEYSTGTGTGYGGSYGSDTGYGTAAGVGQVGHTPDTGYKTAGAGYTPGAPHTTHPGGEEKKHGLLGKLHKSGGSSSSSSSDEEAGEGKERRKKGGIKEKIKSVLPGHKKEEDPTRLM
ncbi:hypothetical protein O6H91_17G006000 [Diphasiastrum complanatum]|uniref:Uncharacterized protein n=1 Tax=Diphasiastrum complanatum TaxID=34168 RepID=A0ACC2B3U4_DIPCM|nr:hypothetical protein O6H91_17G006000 [Diphasiastrum complanatum]